MRDPLVAGIYTVATSFEPWHCQFPSTKETAERADQNIETYPVVVPVTVAPPSLSSLVGATIKKIFGTARATRERYILHCRALSIRATRSAWYKRLPTWQGRWKETKTGGK